MTRTITWKLDPEDQVAPNTYRISSNCNAYRHVGCNVEHCFCACHGKTQVDTVEEQTIEESMAEAAALEGNDARA